MKQLSLLPFFLLLFFRQPLHAQDTLSKDSLLQVISALRAEKAQEAAPELYPAEERRRDSLLAAMPDPRSEYERERAKAEKAWPWIGRSILLGAAVFVLWAALYKRRYREMHTRNGVYTGIGSKYFHDHYETDHYSPGRYGVRAEDDPWCHNEYWQGQPGRKGRERRNGGGASGSW